MTSSNAGSIAALVSAATTGAAAATVILLLTQRRKQRKDANSPADDVSAEQSPTCATTPHQTLEVIRHRRSIFPKQYTGSSVPRAIIDDMLEAARWAPSHKISEAWRFVVFESDDARSELGKFLAEQYKSAQEASGKPFLQAKFDKKMKNTAVSSHVIAVVVDATGSGEKKTTNPLWEEIASVATAVQNMLLVATAHGVGAYWSSGSVILPGGATGDDQEDGVALAKFNPSLNKFLDLSKSQYCLGWIFVGEYDTKKKWPSGKRRDINADGKVIWR